MSDIAHWIGALWSRKERPRQKCRECGRCCDLYGGNLRASNGDIERWGREGRAELLSRVGRLGWIWTNPDSGRLFNSCPYLIGTPPHGGRCQIHETKPEMCRAYPTLAHDRRCVSGVVFQ